MESLADSGARRFGERFSAANLLRAPLAALLEHYGILRPGPGQLEHVASIGGATEVPPAAAAASGAEVSIRIIGAADQDSRTAVGAASEPDRRGRDDGSRNGDEEGEGVSVSSSSSTPRSGSGGVESTDPEEEAARGGGRGEWSSYRSYDIQQLARGVEQVLPFSLLLLVVFIRQHLQGAVIPRIMCLGMHRDMHPNDFLYFLVMMINICIYILLFPFLSWLHLSRWFYVTLDGPIGFFVTIWIAAVMFKSNDILRKQTALKGERKFSVLVGLTLVFVLHVFGVYWWYQNDDLLYPLVMLPPKEIPPFWHAIFIIVVNDTMVRQAAMVFKCVLLLYYKNSRGRSYRNQGQMLTLMEYLLLLYRALLPTPVWYRFFLNKEYGSLFSSLTTGLYLTFKLTSVVEKVQLFFAALKALSHKEVHYGSHATIEQVIAAGDLCAICQEKMHAPILLRCKHIFCEDCVSEWFERERTCPLCRALVKPAGLRSFGDGSTSLFFQLF